VSRHVTKTFAAPVVHVLCLVDVGHIFGDHGFTEHVEALEDALVGEVQATIAVVTVLLHHLHLRTFLGDMSLFVAVVTEVVAASAS